MARPRKLRRDPEKPARTFSELQALYDTAERLYLITGGESIDLQIDALDYTQRAYRSQMNYIERDGGDQNAWGPTVTPYESRMTAGTHAKLQKLREQKMQQCLQWAEEGAEAAAERKGTACPEPVEGVPDFAKATSGGPEVRDCPRPSEETQTVEIGKAPEPHSAAHSATKLHPGHKHGDSPTAKIGREQSPLGPEAHVFVDAPVALPAAGLTERIAKMLGDMPGMLAGRSEK